MNILITGGLGNLGVALIDQYALNPNIQIFIVDNIEGNKKKVAKIYIENKNIHFKELKTLNFKQYLNIHSNVDLVIHLARIPVSNSGNKLKRKIVNQNHNLTKAIADFCNNHKIPLIYPSSTILYHNLSGIVNEESLITNALTDYSQTKLLDESYINSLRGLKYSILRLGSVHGFSNGMKFNTVVNKFCWQYSKGIPLSVWIGTLDVARPYLSISDFIGALNLIVDKMIFSRQVFNVVSNTFALDEIIRTIEIVGGHKAELEFEAKKNISFNSINVSTSKIQNEGYKFSGSLETDVRETLISLGANDSKY